MPPDFTAIDVPCRTDAPTMAMYARDESAALLGAPIAVFTPRSLPEVREVICWAVRESTPVTVSGAGTSITGSRVATEGVVLSTERIRAVDQLGDLASGGAAGESVDGEVLANAGYSIRLCRSGERAIVPAGIRLSELDALLAGRDLVYPPDPTEMTAMIGGTIATNASGARSFRYGPTRKWIDGLLVVAATGRSMWIRRGEYVARDRLLPLPAIFPADSIEIPDAVAMPATKHAAGYYLEPHVDLIDLIIGSEGTLAVVVAAEVRLAPRPDSVFYLAAFFPSPDAAFAAADRARPDQDVLSVEYFDRNALDLMRGRYPDVPESGACVVFDVTYRARGRHNPYPAGDCLDRWHDLLKEAGSTGEWVATGTELAGMKAFRHALPESINRWVSTRVGKLGTDMAVPAEGFSSIHNAYTRVARGPIRTALFGHLGQYHLHLNFLPEDESELQTARRRYLELAREAVALGGSISAEHGVGRKQLGDEEGVSRPYLFYQYGSAGVHAIQRIKSVLDPEWLLNPGAVVPRP